MNKRLLMLFSFLIAAGMSIANNVQLSNVTIINNGPGNIQVQFNISWDNSWRFNTGPANYDGAWVFFKYKTASGNWTHMVLTGSNNVVPAGFDIYQTNDFNKAGAMIYRDALNMGKGSVDVQGVKLGVVNTLPYDIDVKGFAVEMVYIPAPTTRPFFGDGDGTNESVNAFHYIDNLATSGSVVPMHVDANAYDDDVLESSGLYVYSNDTIQVASPLGPLDPFPTMKALWCMKYEISQAAYRDFLNTLSLPQQTSRTANAPTSAKGTNALVATGLAYRNHIEIKTPSANGAPAVYGCDANGNNTYDEADDGEWVACNFLLWTDVAAYLDWSGLAPLSELQYERICRGHTSAGANAAVYNEFAWGNSSIYNSAYTLTNPNTSSEKTATNIGSKGNANWINTTPASPENGPLRNGEFATASSNRVSSGAAFFGVMEMTGNVSEYCITMGTAAGRSVRFIPNGNGTISTAGNAQLSVGALGFWPGMEGNNSSSATNTCSGTCEVTGVGGIMLRGGNWSTSILNTFSIAARSSALPSSSVRYYGFGGRGVLYIR